MHRHTTECTDMHKPQITHNPDGSTSITIGPLACRALAHILGHVRNAELERLGLPEGSSIDPGYWSQPCEQVRVTEPLSGRDLGAVPHAWALPEVR